MVGRCESLPEHRRISSGCYLHNLIVNDVKIGSWMNKLAVSIMAASMKDWFDKLGAFVTENKLML